MPRSSNPQSSTAPEASKRRRAIAIVAVLLVLAMLSLIALLVSGPSPRGARAAGSGGGATLPAPPPVPPVPGQRPAPRPLALPSQQDVAQIVESYGRAVVMIAVESGSEVKSIGSGFLVSPEGLVVTNHHVVARRLRDSQVRVRLVSGKTYPVRSVVVSDPERDIAVLALDGTGLPIVTLGDSDTLKQGQRIVVIGHPQGLANSVSDGIVSAIRSLKNGNQLVQITAPISPGNSGGPVFNMAGEVVAVTIGYLSGGQNLNFSIPVNEVVPLIQRASRQNAANREPR